MQIPSKYYLQNPEVHLLSVGKTADLFQNNLLGMKKMLHYRMLKYILKFLL